jgi:predicted nucleic acid-binding protein
MMVAKQPKYYWDSCAWLGFLNGEANRKRELEIIYGLAKQGKCEIWTSTLSFVEVRRLENEKDLPRPLSDKNLQTIQNLFRQPFVKPIPLAVDIADRSRQIFRETSGINKWQDAIHLASALRWSVDVLHTYDHDDLLAFSLKFECKNGEKLPICYPDETTDGPLFGHAKTG